MTDNSNNRAEVVGLWAGTLAATEVGLGSILHGFHLPLAGTIMSLNQAAFLTRATRNEQNDPSVRSLPFEISSITAVLKSFSPMGKRLTPMFAISSQGALYSLAIYLAGPNLFGVIFGAALLATWGVVQPLALAGLMFWSLSNSDKEKIIFSWEKITSELSFLNTENLETAIIYFLILKCSVAILISITAWLLLPNKKSLWLQTLTKKLTSPVAKGSFCPTDTEIIDTRRTNPFVDALTDLRKPLVILSSLLLIGLALLVDSDWVAAFWIGMRTVGITYASYVILRWIPWEELLTGDSKSKKTLRIAIGHFRRLQIQPNPEPIRTKGRISP